MKYALNFRSCLSIDDEVILICCWSSTFQVNAGAEPPVNNPQEGEYDVPMQVDDDPLAQPPHGTSVFIGSIHRSATQDQVKKFASEAGEVFDVKLIRDTGMSQQHRGYGFIVYKTREGALTAMDRLHGKELPDFPGQKVRVQPSQVKNRLYIGGIPHSMTKEELKDAIEGPFGLKGLQSIEISKNRERPEENRGFAFLEFYNGACATHAKTQLTKPDVRVGDRTITVDLAEISGRDAWAAQGSRAIFIGSLPPGVTEDQLREAFAKYGEVEKINIPRPKPGEEHAKFAFLHFAERLAAARAVDDIEKPSIDGIELAVKYGRSEAPQSGGGVGGGFRGTGGRGRFGGGGGGRGGGYPGGYGGPMMGGMISMIPVQLPTGQMGYMMQPNAMMGQGGGYDQYYRGGGGGGGRGRGGGRGGYNSRYQPY